MKKRIIKFLATSLGLGLSPKLPGTLTSLVTMLIAYGCHIQLLPLIIIWFMVTIAGWFIADLYEQLYNKKDPGEVTIDEVSGQLLSLIPVISGGFVGFFIAFALFRFFDMVKPLGIHKIQKLPGGLGVMADDILAALYTILVLYVGAIWIK